MARFVIKNPICPECGELAEGTLEEVPGVALLSINRETGEADYAGETKLFWNGQVSSFDTEERHILVCPSGHEWSMERTDEKTTDEPGQPG